MSRLLEEYNNQIKKELMSKLGLKNIEYLEYDILDLKTISILY